MAAILPVSQDEVSAGMYSTSEAQLVKAIREQMPRSVLEGYSTRFLKLAHAHISFSATNPA
jgi:hypothetical protein